MARNLEHDHEKFSEQESSPIQNGGLVNIGRASQDLMRMFVVVMDYDPQSLCITGKPELELSLQSGNPRFDCCCNEVILVLFSFV